MVLTLIIGGACLVLLGVTGSGWLCFTWGKTEGRLTERSHRMNQDIKAERARYDAQLADRPRAPWSTFTATPSNSAWPGTSVPSYTPKATPRPDADTVAGGFPAVPGYVRQAGAEGWARHAADPAAAATKTAADYQAAQQPRHAAPLNGHPYPQMIP